MSLQLVWATGSAKPFGGEGSICITYDQKTTTENISFSGSNMNFSFKSGSEMIIGEEETANSFYRFSKEGDIAFSKAGTDAETLISLKDEELKVSKRDDKDSKPIETIVTTIGTGSFGFVSSSLVPNKDNTYHLG